MRIADPAELNPEMALESVLTAAMPPDVVTRLSNAMRDVDAFDAPGPAKIAALALDAGPMVALVYHELKELLEVLAPVDATTEAAIAEIVNVLRIPRESVEWVHDGIALSRVYRDDDLAAPAGHTFWQVAASPALVQREMTAAESISLALLVVRLRHMAGEMPPLGDTDVRVIHLRDTIVFEDGREAAPLALYYTISGSTAFVVDIEHLAGESVRIASGTLTSVLTQVASLR